MGLGIFAILYQEVLVHMDKTSDQLLNGKKNLEELFADLEINGHEPISSTSHTDRVLPGFRKLIKMDNLPGKIQLVLEKCS